MDRFLKEAWFNLDSTKRTRAILEGTELKVMKGDVQAVTATLVTNGSLVLWNPRVVQEYTNTLPATSHWISDVSRVVKPIIEATGVELPEAIKYRLRTRLGKRVILGMGRGYASMTCFDPDCGFLMEDGGELESDGFLGGGYTGKPFAHGWIYKTVEKVMRRFAVSRVEVADNFNGHGHAVLRFSGSFKGKPVQLALLNCRLDPGDEDHALYLVREWGK